MEARYKRGDIGPDGRIFWDYRRIPGRRETLRWCSPAVFKERKEKETARSQRKWAEGYRMDPFKQSQREKLHYAVRRGLIAKPDQCQSCGAQSPIEAHHHNGYEDAFDVQWLCRTCHGAQHRKAAAA